MDEVQDYDMVENGIEVLALNNIYLMILPYALTFDSTDFFLFEFCKVFLTF